MKIKEAGKLKKILQLRIEYLKQSDVYKEYCEWKKNGIRAPTSPIPVNLKSNPKRFQCKMNYVFYGDIHHPNFLFKEWWKRHRLLNERSDNCKETHPKISDSNSVIDGTDQIGYEIDWCITAFKKAQKREPTPQELKKSFLEMLKTTNCIRRYIKVYPFCDRLEIERKFKKILKDLKKNPRIRELELGLTHPFINLSTNHIRLDELERHLRIYLDFKGGKKMEEIANNDNYYKKHTSEDPETKRREILMDREKARRIIKNVEEGVFPGRF